LKLIPVKYFIVLQVIVFLPLALIRDLAKLSTTVLVADAFILAGLIYIFGSEFSILAKNGIADVKWFNPKDFSLFIGYVCSSIFLCHLEAYSTKGRPCFLSKVLAWYVVL